MPANDATRVIGFIGHGAGPRRMVSSVQRRQPRGRRNRESPAVRFQHRTVPELVAGSGGLEHEVGRHCHPTREEGGHCSFPRVETSSAHRRCGGLRSGGRSVAPPPACNGCQLRHHNSLTYMAISTGPRPEESHLTKIVDRTVRSRARLVPAFHAAGRPARRRSRPVGEVRIHRSSLRRPPTRICLPMLHACSPPWRAAWSCRADRHAHIRIQRRFDAIQPRHGIAERARIRRHSAAGPPSSRSNRLAAVLPLTVTAASPSSPNVIAPRAGMFARDWGVIQQVCLAEAHLVAEVDTAAIYRRGVAPPAATKVEHIAKRSVGPDGRGCGLMVSRAPEVDASGASCPRADRARARSFAPAMRMPNENAAVLASQVRAVCDSSC